MPPRTWIGLAALAGSAIASLAIRRTYRRDMEAVTARLEAGSRSADTDSGPIEYGRDGAGPAALIVHGAGGGYDQGLLLGRELLGPDHDIIAPSRFGYLGTPLPEAAGIEAQADAHKALLDALGIDKVLVMGVSAGAPSAIELALRHPDRVSALILVVPRAYAPNSAVSAEPIRTNRPIMAMIEKGQDFAFWVAARGMRRRLLRFIGVPESVYDAADPLDRARLDSILLSIQPLSRRAAGIRNDGLTEIGERPLANIQVPALVVSAEDDLFNTLPAARFCASRIPGAELMVVESGGHLLCSRTDEIRGRIADFLRRSTAQQRAAA